MNTAQEIQLLPLSGARGTIASPSGVCREPERSEVDGTPCVNKNES